MKRLDFSILLGLLLGLAAICGSALFEGIRPGFLWQPHAALIVMGGTLAAVIVGRGLKGLLASIRAAFSLCFKVTSDETEVTVARLTWLARAAKREGVQVLENHAETCKDILVARGLLLAAEYAPPMTVRAALDRILDYESERGLRDAATIEAAAGYMPTFGILGAVLGLIQVLRVLDQPALLGAGIATAFVATIYGVGIANLLLYPIASRLRERHTARIKDREALADVIVALSAHEPPNAMTDKWTSHTSLESWNQRRQTRKAASQ